MEKPELDLEMPGWLTGRAFFLSLASSLRVTGRYGGSSPALPGLVYLPLHLDKLRGWWSIGRFSRPHRWAACPIWRSRSAARCITWASARQLASTTWQTEQGAGGAFITCRKSTITRCDPCCSFGFPQTKGPEDLLRGLYHFQRIRSRRNRSRRCRRIRHWSRPNRHIGSGTPRPGSGPRNRGCQGTGTFPRSMPGGGDEASFWSVGKPNMQLLLRVLWFQGHGTPCPHSASIAARRLPSV